jgi:DNA-binding HxlR family transcriptional regulator
MDTVRAVGLTTMSADPDLLAGISEAAAVLGDRWSAIVIAALLDGPLRYGELRERVAGIAPNILSAKLKKLERDGLIASALYSERPPRFEYRLTETGTELSDLLRLMAAWGGRRTAAGRTSGAPVHSLCGTPLQVQWWCPTCLEAVEPDGEEPISV